MANSQINKLSKRQILESLYHEQNQSTVTLSRFMTAVARSLNIDPEQLAKAFNEEQPNQEYIAKFNEALRGLQIPDSARVDQAGSAESDEAIAADTGSAPETDNNDEQK
jgi:hypothetical protein